MTPATDGCECPECSAQRLFDAVLLDHQPKSAEDAVYVSGKWRDRILELAGGGVPAPPPITTSTVAAAAWPPIDLAALKVILDPQSIRVHVSLLPRRTMIVSPDLADEFKAAFPPAGPS